MMKYALLTVLLLAGFLLPAQKKLVYTDFIYEPQIKTVQSFSDQSVEFDDLQDDRNNYYAKLIHCNYDWTKSLLQDLDFMQEYNEFTINEYAISNNLYPAYVHYRFQLPKVKVPGNYLLIVYRDGDKSDLILSRRFFIADNLVTLQVDKSFSGAGTLRTSNQQLNFILNYGNVEILNPQETVHVVIRQNQRWDNARMDVKPSFVRDDRSELEYRFFDQDKHFTAGNEFRFVDFRSLNFPGQNTGKLDRSIKPFQLSVQLDKSRTNQAYAQYLDLNGGYRIENLDYGEPAISGNYIETTFSLQAPRSVDGDVYIIGAFNNWVRDEENKMIYNPGKGVYESTLYLKQGLYNYEYTVENSQLSPDYFEGSHFETENVYEVFVYNRPFRPNADLLIGYFVLPVNPR